MSKLDVFFESKTFKQIVQITMLIIWIISGIAGFVTISGTTLQAQWSFGALFGLGLLYGSEQIALAIFWILYHNIRSFRKYIQTHWENYE